jgi:transposase
VRPLRLAARRQFGTKFGTSTAQIRALAAWLTEHHVVEVAMESTALYWRPVWLGLESQVRLHLAQARANPAPRGRKTDFQDALRIVRRLLAHDLTLSWVPPAEQRLWRVLARTRVQLIQSLQIQELERQLADAQQAYAEAIARLCRVPRIDLHAARQIVAGIGPEVAAFASPEKLAAWAGVCPGRQESAGISYSNRSPRAMRIYAASSTRQLGQRSATRAATSRSVFSGGSGD